MPTRFGARGIHTAAKEGHVSVIDTLIKKGEHVDTKTGDGMSSLHIAVENGKATVVECLIGHGANVHLKGGAHVETPLHIAGRIDEAKGENAQKFWFSQERNKILQCMMADLRYTLELHVEI
jgi:ankyrin repeat protein